MPNPLRPICTRRAEMEILICSYQTGDAEPAIHRLTTSPPIVAAGTVHAIRVAAAKVVRQITITAAGSAAQHLYALRVYALAVRTMRRVLSLPTHRNVRKTLNGQRAMNYGFYACVKPITQKAAGVLSVTPPRPGEDATTALRPGASVASMVFAARDTDAECALRYDDRANALMVNAKSVMWQTMPAAMTPVNLCAVGAKPDCLWQ